MAEKVIFAPFRRRILFYATRCPHCHLCLKALRNIELDAVLPASLRIEKIDVDLSPSYGALAMRFAKRLGVGYLPTPLLVFGGMGGIAIVKQGIDYGENAEAIYENFLRTLINREAEEQGIPLKLELVR